jgi:hypothetical protein
MRPSGGMALWQGQTSGRRTSRASTFAHIYPAPLHVVLTRMHRTRIKTLLLARWTRTIQDRESELRRITLPRTPGSRALPPYFPCSSGATPAACWTPAMAATRALAPWPRCPPRRRKHPHSARSGSRPSTHRVGPRRVGYALGGLGGKPLLRLPVGLLLSCAARSRWAPRLRLRVFSFVAVAGCTTGSPRPYGCPHVPCGTKIRASTPPRVARSLWM